MRTISLSPTTLVVVFGAAVLISLVGVYLAYHTHITSSTAWMKWGNDQAWVGDSVRLVLLATFAALLILVSFNVGRPRTDRVYRIKVDAKNVAITLVFFATVTTLNFYYYPIYFELELSKNTHRFLSDAELAAAKTDHFGEVYKPFFAYYFYALPLWMLIILPTFLIFLEGFIRDYAGVKERIGQLGSIPRRFDSSAKADLAAQTAGLSEELSHLEHAADSCIEGLRYVVQRYLPVLLVVLIGYVAGNIVLSDQLIATDRVFVHAQTPEARSSFGWIIIIFLAIFFAIFIYFARLFERYRRTVADRLDALVSIIEVNSLHHSLRDVIKTRSQSWDTRRIDVLPFLFSTLIRTGTIHLPLLLICTLALFSVVVTGYLQAIVPLSIQEFVQTYFLRPKPATGTP